MREMRARTVVVGSGCAGLNGADTLAALGEKDLLLVTEDMNAGTSRNTGSDKQTYYKLSLSGDDADSVGEMARTLCRGDVNGDTALCEAAASAPCFLKLCGLGVPFPTNEYGEYVGYRTDHDTRRRATSAGPLTSRFMTEALEESVRRRGVPVLDRALAARIVTDDKGVAALDVYLTEEREYLRIRCANVLLCTGGPAHIYRDRVYPDSQHGMSGLAFEAGAEGANLDCWQYGLASVKFKWNLSGSYQQAVPRVFSVDERGVEREFLADALGEREAMAMTFLKGYQWPFDPRNTQGSSRVDLLVKREGDLGRRVYLDYRKNPRGFSGDAIGEEARNYLENCGALLETPLERLGKMNPPAIQLYLDHGIDLAREPLEMRVCAQHHNGGAAVDAHWQTRVPGLYVCGEAAGTFGRRRPGGTALNAAQAGSLRAANHAFRNGRTVSSSPLPFEEIRLPAGDAEAFQAEMSRCAAFERDRAGMEALLERVREALATEEKGREIPEGLKLRDLLVTQSRVLSAMLCSLAEEGEPEGVLMTDEKGSRRVPARPIPERDLWFETVWARYRAENGR